MCLIVQSISFYESLKPRHVIEDIRKLRLLIDVQKHNIDIKKHKSNLHDAFIISSNRKFKNSSPLSTNKSIYKCDMK